MNSFEMSDMDSFGDKNNYSELLNNPSGLNSNPSGRIFDAKSDNISTFFKKMVPK